MIGRLLDGGAHGIIAPRVETAEQARLARRGLPLPAARASLAARAASAARHGADARDRS